MNGKYFSPGDMYFDILNIEHLFNSKLKTILRFQGSCGDCFFIAAIIGLLRNKELLGHIIPADNTLPISKKSGSYHFRFWKLGDWYDVVGKLAIILILTNFNLVRS